MIGGLWLRRCWAWFRIVDWAVLVRSCVRSTLVSLYFVLRNTGAFISALPLNNNCILRPRIKFDLFKKALISILQALFIHITK